jgi:probable rRNA maturation factor
VILITVQDKYQDQVAEQKLITAAEAVIHGTGTEDSPSLSLRITDNEELFALNLQFRGIKKTTDVLSFPADFMDPDLESRYLGDVVISYPQAAEQAQKRGHGVEAELQLLVIHGVLHLLGYDHGNKKEKEEMWSLQSRILAELGLGIQVEDE